MTHDHDPIDPINPVHEVACTIALMVLLALGWCIVATHPEPTDPSGSVPPARTPSKPPSWGPPITTTHPA